VKTAAWIAGVLVILLAFVSPLGALADGYLFSAHMAKHILLVLVAPALLLSGIPVQSAIGSARRIASVISWSAGIGAMLLWHIPRIFDLAMLHHELHAVENLSLLIAGTIFWWPILAPLPEARLEPVPQGVAYLFTACLACTGMGIVITFAPSLIYAASMSPNNWGISPAMDQQIGGLLMWVPCCLVYLSAIMVLFARWYGQENENQERIPEPREVQFT